MPSLAGTKRHESHLPRHRRCSKQLHDCRAMARIDRDRRGTRASLRYPVRRRPSGYHADALFPATSVGYGRYVNPVRPHVAGSTLPPPSQRASLTELSRWMLNVKSKARLHLRIDEGCIDFPVELGDDRGGRALRNAHTRPVDRLVAGRPQSKYPAAPPSAPRWSHTEGFAWPVVLFRLLSPNLQS
jgi:hypothetical protein